MIHKIFMSLLISLLCVHSSDASYYNPAHGVIHGSIQIHNNSIWCKCNSCGRSFTKYDNHSCQPKFNTPPSANSAAAPTAVQLTAEQIAAIEAQKKLKKEARLATVQANAIARANKKAEQEYLKKLKSAQAAAAKAPEGSLVKFFPAMVKKPAHMK